jgi:hypothetical protein
MCRGVPFKNIEIIALLVKCILLKCCLVSGEGPEADEKYVFLGYYAAYAGNFLTMFQDNLSVPSLKMGPIGCPETSVRNYHHTIRHESEERRSQLLKC